MEQAAKNLLRISMELGGNAPFLVFADADLDAAVEGALIAKMRNNGESCVAANRFHVAAEVAEEFARRLADRMGALKVGHGADEGVQVGPLIDEDQRGKVEELVADAIDQRREGARRAARGSTGRATSTRRRCSPASGAGRTDPARGGVRPGRAGDDVRLRRRRRSQQANATEFGLVAYVFTRDLKRALRVVEGLETGMVGLNRGLVSNAAAPFGGVKHSGFGREGGTEGIEEYLETKYVAIDL